MAPEPFDSEDHIQRELNLLELRLQREIVSAKAERGSVGRYDEFAGLFISDEEIDRYFSGTSSAPSESPDSFPLDKRIAEAEQALALEMHEAVEAGSFLRLKHLSDAFSLEPLEYQTLIACMAPDLDMRFERYFAYLQNDVSKKRPCVQLLGKLFMGVGGACSVLRYLVAEVDSLVGLRLLKLISDSGVGLAARELKVFEGIIHFILGVDAPDPDLGGLGKLRTGSALPGRASYYSNHHTCLRRLIGLARRDGQLPYSYVHGPEGCGKEDVVMALAHCLSADVLECSGEELLSYSGDWHEWLRILERDLRLRTGFLWVRHGDTLLAADDGHRSRLYALGSFLRGHPAVNVIITGEQRQHSLGELLGVTFLEFAIQAPSLSERMELWREATEEEGVALHLQLAEELAAKFKFGPGKICAALQRLRFDDPGEFEPADSETLQTGLEERIHHACRLESNPALETYAQKITPRHGWNDLVLPHDVLEHLREIRNCVRYRQKVHGEWGFENKFSLGKGLQVLFSGPSGTGKTMSTEVLASDLKLDIYKIDLSSVVSKYIGETEKHLERIFREAESANCILLFDEADALFGKRSEVKDSHDRYANIEINYLLQRMDEYEGTVILTTNMANNLDPAFNRRIQYTVEFQAPDEKHRGLLWSKVFPAATPLDEDLDLDFLAKRFKLSGANIKNIAFNSAFLAAANGGVVGMTHVVAALRREYRKLGKLASPSEFGPYYHLVCDEPNGSEGRWQ